jgi:hypothetical protein
LRLVSDGPRVPGEQGDLVSRLRAVIVAKDEQAAGQCRSRKASVDEAETAEPRWRPRTY